MNEGVSLTGNTKVEGGWVEGRGWWRGAKGGGEGGEEGEKVEEGW